jgi:hypothetical protein
MPLFSQSRIMDLALPKEEALRRLGRVTNFCHAGLSTRAKDVYCSVCGRGPIRFEGKITEVGFQIKPLPRWKDWRGKRSDTPVITGDIHESAGRARISIKMRQETSAVIAGLAGACLFGLVSLFLFMTVFTGKDSQGDTGMGIWVVLLPLFPAAFLFLSVPLSFRKEAKWAYGLLERLWSSG